RKSTPATRSLSDLSPSYWPRACSAPRRTIWSSASSSRSSMEMRWRRTPRVSGIGFPQGFARGSQGVDEHVETTFERLRGYGQRRHDLDHLIVAAAELDDQAMLEGVPLDPSGALGAADVGQVNAEHHAATADGHARLAHDEL